MAVDIDDMQAYQKELKEDYIINKEVSNLAGSASLFCGRFLALANAALITAKHVDFSVHTTSEQHGSVQQNPVQQCPVQQLAELGRDAEGVSFARVDEVPGYPAKVPEHCSPNAE